jgi:hypothetical protein
MNQVSIKYTIIFHCKTLQNLPKFEFLVWKQTIWQPRRRQSCSQQWADSKPVEMTPNCFVTLQKISLKGFEANIFTVFFLIYSDGDGKTHALIIVLKFVCKVFEATTL